MTRLLCRDHTEVVSLLGGLEDRVRDVLTGEMPVCSAAQGVDSALRFSLLRHRLASVLQPPWVPAFTEEGIKVMEVPSRLMGMINMARVIGIKMMEEEDCLAEVACFNCQKLYEDKKECKLPKHSGRQMIVPISQQLKVQKPHFKVLSASQNSLTILSCLIHFKV